MLLMNEVTIGSWHEAYWFFFLYLKMFRSLLLWLLLDAFYEINHCTTPEMSPQRACDSAAISTELSLSPQVWKWQNIVQLEIALNSSDFYLVQFFQAIYYHTFHSPNSPRSSPPLPPSQHHVLSVSLFKKNQDKQKEADRLPKPKKQKPKYTSKRKKKK